MRELIPCLPGRSQKLIRILTARIDLSLPSGTNERLERTILPTRINFLLFSERSQKLICTLGDHRCSSSIHVASPSPLRPDREIGKSGEARGNNSINRSSRGKKPKDKPRCLSSNYSGNSGNAYSVQSSPRKKYNQYKRAETRRSDSLTHADTYSNR